MEIPSEYEWLNKDNDLDVESARDDFFGLNYDQALQAFKENSLRYQTGLLFMPFACFSYYIQPYVDYLLSDSSKGDPDGASCFLGLVECRFEDFMNLSLESQQRIDLLLERLSKEQSFYDADEGIYGNFEARISGFKRFRQN